MHRQTLSCQNASTLGRAARLNRPRTAVSTRHLVSRRGLHVIAFDEGSMKGGAEEKGTNTRTVPITLSVPLKVAFGEHVRVVGADQTLGGWEVGCAPEMRWGEGHRWSVRLELPDGFESEYKLVHCMPGKPPVWEHTPNRLLTVAAPPSQEDPSSSAVEVELQWCSPPHATAEPVEMAVADTLDANDLSATTPAFKVGPPLFESFSSGESGSISVTDVEEVGILADQEKEKERDVQVSETTTVLGAIDAAIMSAEEERIEETNSLEASQQESAFKSAAKTAGAVALGVAGAALLSALAIDVADTAIMGAVAVAAGSAALSGSTSSKKKSQKDGEMESLDDPAQHGDSQLEGENRTTTSTEPGVIIAAGIMSALDAGKAVVKSFDKDVERDEE